MLIEAGAGVGSAIADTEYEAQGARIVANADAVFDDLSMYSLEDYTEVKHVMIKVGE